MGLVGQRILLVLEIFGCFFPVFLNFFQFFYFVLVG